MIVLGQEETAVCDDLRMDLPALLMLDRCLRFLSQLPLFGVMHENKGGILPGPALVRGIMARPEDAQQIAVRYLRGIVIDLDGLGMVAERVVRGVLFCPASVPNARPDNSGKTPEPGVGSPESAHAEGGNSDLLRNNGIDQGF